MPKSVNGCGTMVCGAAGHLRWGEVPVGWNEADDYDAVECLCFFTLPIIAYKAIHTFNWTSAERFEEHYQSNPIRWSWALVLRAYLRRWLLLPQFAGIMFVCIGLLGPETLTVRFLSTASGLLLTAACGLGWWALRATDRRNRDLRRVLGPGQFGSSDPATWTDEVLAQVQGPAALFGTCTYAAAVRPLLASGDFPRAMLAARLAAAVEDREVGEGLTDTILGHPVVQVAVERVRRDPSVGPRPCT